VTTFRAALGRDITVLSAPAILRRDDHTAVIAERAVLLLHYDVDGIHLRYSRTGQLCDAWTRWMQQMGLVPVDDIRAMSPGGDWLLRPRGDGAVRRGRVWGATIAAEYASPPASRPSP